MNNMIAWFAQNKVAANLLMILILFAGLFSAQSTKKAILPNINMDVVMITIPYPGASSVAVEEGVVWRVESVLAGISGINTCESFARENAAVVKCVISTGYDAREVKENIKSQVESIDGFPSHVERPVVRLIAFHREPVATIVLSGEADVRSLKGLAESVRNDLLDYAEISQVEISNVPNSEISIEVSELAMQRYGLSFSELAAAIKQQSVNIAAGSIDTDSGSTMVKTVGQAYTAAQYEDLVVRSLPDGGRVLIKDVATVTEGYQAKASVSKFNAKPAVFLYVYRSGNQNILKIASILRSYVKNPGTYLPESISIDISQDISYYFKSRVELLGENGLSGLLLLFLVLMLFLRWKLSFWVSVGIPISFMGAFWMLPLFGGSFNMVSLFAFILVLGIVVDDAIIIGENIFTQMRRGNTGVRGAILGAQELAKPVIFAVVTTMIMFVPLLFLPGPEGQLMRVVPIVVIATLAFSLLESLLILPAHLSSIKDVNSVDHKNRFGKIHDQFVQGLERFIEHYFRPLIRWALDWRYPVTMFFIMLLMITISLFSGGWLKMVLFSTVEADYSVASVTFAQGTAKDKTNAAVEKIERAALTLQQDLEQEFGVEQIQGVTSHYGASGLKKGDHLGSVMIEMTPSEKRHITGTELNQRWREYVGEVPEAVQLKFDSTLNTPGATIDYEFTGLDFDELREVSEAFKEHLVSYEGVFDVRDSMQAGNPEIQLHLNRLAQDIGVRLGDVATQVRQAFYGVDIQSVHRGQEELSVILRYPEEERKSLWYLENMQVRLPSGESVPLSMIADIEYAYGPKVIRHVDQRRAVGVQASVEEGIDARKINRDVKADFLKEMELKYPDVKWHLGGIKKHEQQFIDFLMKSSVLALFVMYMLMAILFKSYMQPLIIMYAIPFGVIGALLGHLILNMDVTLWSIIGMTAVSGVVVNDNLVLINFINTQRAKGAPLMFAIREAGAARFRPIVLTSITTFCGLLPLMLEKSVQAQFLIPMAVSLAFGVMFATLVSLILVPLAYHILEDLRRLIKTGFAVRISGLGGQALRLENGPSVIAALPSELSGPGSDQSGRVRRSRKSRRSRFQKAAVDPVNGYRTGSGARFDSEPVIVGDSSIILPADEADKEKALTAQFVRADGMGRKNSHDKKTQESGADSYIDKTTAARSMRPKKGFRDRSQRVTKGKKTMKNSRVQPHLSDFDLVSDKYERLEKAAARHVEEPVFVTDRAVTKTRVRKRAVSKTHRIRIENPMAEKQPLEDPPLVTDLVNTELDAAQAKQGSQALSYEQAYRDGLRVGKSGGAMKPSADMDEVLQASWEAGWEDGRQSMDAQESPDLEAI